MISQASGYGILAGQVVRETLCCSSLIKNLPASELLELQALWNWCQKDKTKRIEGVVHAYSPLTGETSAQVLQTKKKTSQYYWSFIILSSVIFQSQDPGLPRELNTTLHDGERMCQAICLKVTFLKVIFKKRVIPLLQHRDSLKLLCCCLKPKYQQVQCKRHMLRFQQSNLLAERLLPYFEVQDSGRILLLIFFFFPLALYSNTLVQKNLLGFRY